MSARKTVVTLATAAGLAMAVPAVKGYEGYWPTVKPDKLAGGLPTGGYGETEGVRLGETHDEKFWADRLARRLADEYDAGIGQCIHVELPDGVRAMAISTAYNAGVSAVCHSPMVAKWNAGDIRGGCEAIRGWRVGSHPHGPKGPLVVQKGLVNRRNSEASKCLAGINPAPAARRPVLPIDAAAPVAAPVKVASRPKPKPAAPPAKPSPWCWFFKCEAKANG